MITSKITVAGHHVLYKDGVRVGRAWRWPVGSSRLGGSNKRKVGFGLVIDGWYWHKGEANRRGGSSATGTRTLRDAIALTEKVLA